MRLLRDIQNAAIDSDKPISDLLRRCKVLAVRLGNSDFEAWVNSELNGYQSKDGLPPYRIHGTHSKGHFVGVFGRQLRNALMPMGNVPKEFREFVSHVRMNEPIASLEDLLRRTEEGSPDGDLQVVWPPDLTARIGGNFYEDMNCLSAWQVVPRGAIIQVIDTVRNKILAFALEIEKMAPTSGDDDADAKAIPNAAVSQVFNQHIYGNVGNIASGNQEVTQTATLSISQGDTSALQRELKKLGIPPEDVTQLEGALSEDKQSGVKGIGPATGSWLAKVFSGAKGEMLRVPVAIGAPLIVKLLSEYLGLK